MTGFKATYGLLSTVGILDGEPVDDFILHVAHSAVMCRSAEDTAVLLNVLSDPDQMTTYHTQVKTGTKPRIGIARNYRATDEVRQVFRQAIDTLQSMGYFIKEVDVPLEPNIDLSQINEGREEVSQSLFQDVDVIVLPTTTDITPTMEQARIGGPTSISADNTFFANYYGLPAMSIPCGFDSNGLPLGLQIVGPMHEENIVLTVAHDYQQRMDWHRRFPIRQL